ncbi:hypothetical protein IWW34DRAFT_768754 [Fusarium oxysporum f. sp. albedinis]|nr:hypothetical protein IWW34DRAFT_768754 [Fusarium oxysporum f. sp. albedinis]KAK2468080.1 hypothetical protein H9L39_20302 [Fusarium oxysporum f. sp. albedinis]
MHRSTSARRRPSPRKVTDPDLVAIRAKFLNALAVKGSALATPLATNLSPRSSHAGPSGTVQRSYSQSRRRRTHRHSTTPRVVVGPDVIHRLPSELGRLHLSSPLIVSSPSRLNLAHKIQAIISNLDSHVHSSSVVAIRSCISGRDCVVSVGGGSAITLARTLGLCKGIPHICIPTTYSGSELHPGELSNSAIEKRNKDIAEHKTLPAVIIYDDNLTRTFPTRFSAPSHEKVMDDLTRARQSPKSDDVCWSYLHLPGV